MKRLMIFCLVLVASTPVAAGSGLADAFHNHLRPGSLDWSKTGHGLEESFAWHQSDETLTFGGLQSASAALAYLNFGIADSLSAGFKAYPVEIARPKMGPGLRYNIPSTAYRSFLRHPGLETTDRRNGSENQRPIPPGIGLSF